MSQAIINTAPTTSSKSAVRTPEVAVGLLIIAVCVIGAMMWGRSAVTGTRVLVVSRDLSRGDVIDETDLSTVSLTSASDIALLPASVAAEVVGMRTTVDIESGSPLTSAQISAASELRPGEGLVGLTIAPGEAPDELSSGDAVRLLTLTRNADGSTSSIVETTSFEVWSVSEQDPLDGSRVVTLKVTVDGATALLGREEIRLMKVGS